MASDLEQLGVGEEMLWSGTTARPPRTDSTDRVLLILAVAALATFVAVVAVNLFWGPALGAIGGFTAVAVFRFWLAYRRRRTTDRRYLVTNTRVVAVDRGKARSAALRALPAAALHTTDDSGVGTITFGARPSLWAQLNADLGGKPVPIALVEVTDARDVYETILEVQAGPLA
ncbi:hypothetical protein [Actinokineospora sp. HUAS TT18]|uniref:hypothetical protein n=1 Tax=Actinokineospora sp. HUAS TT18 TaxID=3447451 RepID=UPI003F51D5DD